MSALAVKPLAQLLVLLAWSQTCPPDQVTVVSPVPLLYDGSWRPWRGWSQNLLDAMQPTYDAALASATVVGSRSLPTLLGPVPQPAPPGVGDGHRCLQHTGGSLREPAALKHRAVERRARRRGGTCRWNAGPLSVSLESNCIQQLWGGELEDV